VSSPRSQPSDRARGEDVGIFSADRSRKRIVFRRFHVEGYVNQYAQVVGSSEGTLVFETESIENTPSGWRALETYRFIDADEFEEVFKLAEPGKSSRLTHAPA
jgi:hypothetical protein